MTTMTRGYRQKIVKYSQRRTALTDPFQRRSHSRKEKTMNKKNNVILEVYCTGESQALRGENEENGEGNTSEVNKEGKRKS